MDQNEPHKKRNSLTSDERRRLQEETSRVAHAAIEEERRLREEKSERLRRAREKLAGKTM